MSTAWWQRFGRAAFFGALIVAVVMALVPQPPDVGLQDKNLHVVAFAALTLLAVKAYPRMPLLRVGERLSFAGALIELAQSIPALHRDCDPLDWVADTMAVAAVLALVRLGRAHVTRRA